MATVVTTAALVYGLVAWINGTGMIEPVWPPSQLELRSTETLGIARDIQRCYEMLGHEPPPLEHAVQAAEGMHGMYCADRVTIDAESVDLETPAGQAVLVHELVHWLQDYNGDADAAECVAAREYDAYMVHREWQKQMGLELYPDEFTIMTRSQCPAAME